MAREGHRLPCATCNVLFESLKAFDAHLPCVRPTHWKDPKFRDVSSKEPPAKEATFIDPFMVDPGGARWAGETTEDRVNSGLRTRRIRALTWEPPIVPHKPVWKKVYEWLMK